MVVYVAVKSSELGELKFGVYSDYFNWQLSYYINDEFQSSGTCTLLSGTYWVHIIILNWESFLDKNEPYSNKKKLYKNAQLSEILGAPIERIQKIYCELSFYKQLMIYIIYVVQVSVAKVYLLFSILISRSDRLFLYDWSCSFRCNLNNKYYNTEKMTILILQLLFGFQKREKSSRSFEYLNIVIEFGDPKTYNGIDYGVDESLWFHSRKFRPIGWWTILDIARNMARLLLSLINIFFVII